MADVVEKALALKNDEYEILTENGFQDFDGLRISKSYNIVKLTFNEIEEILGFELGPSVRTHRPNWSNNEHET